MDRQVTEVIIPGSYLIVAPIVDYSIQLGEAFDLESTSDKLGYLSKMRRKDKDANPGRYRAPEFSTALSQVQNGSPGKHCKAKDRNKKRNARQVFEEPAFRIVGEAGFSYFPKGSCDCLFLNRVHAG